MTCTWRSTTCSAAPTSARPSARGRAIQQFDGAPATQEALKILIAADERLGLNDKAEPARKVYDENFSGKTPNLKAEKDRHWWQFWK